MSFFQELLLNFYDNSNQKEMATVACQMLSESLPNSRFLSLPSDFRTCIESAMSDSVDFGNWPADYVRKRSQNPKFLGALTLAGSVREQTARYLRVTKPVCALRNVFLHG